MFHSVLDSGIELMVSLIDKDKMRTKEKGDLFNLAHSFLAQRFEYHLDSYPGSYGSIILDKAESSKEILNLSEIHKDIIENGVIVKGTTTVDNSDGTFSIHLNTPTRRRIYKIVENLTFQLDDDNNFLQIADLVAGAFSAKYNRKLNKFSSPYKKLLRKKSDGTVLRYGIKVFRK